MKYELAKELKDAGFPGIMICTAPGCVAHGHEVPIAYHTPTLSELIEACGEGEFMLQRTIEGWYADTFECVMPRDRSGYSTPEEAVARLYLSTHGEKEDA